MTLHARALALYALAILAFAPASSAATALTHASVILDLQTGRVHATRGAVSVDTTLVDVEDLGRGLGALVDIFAAGRDDEDARRRWGEALLAPLSSVLRDAPTWTFELHGAESTPGPLIALPTLVLPWSAPPTEVGLVHAVAFAWPKRDGPTQAPTAAGAAPVRALLLAAPFEAGVAPRTDDPDTLRRGLRAAAARVDLLPRNEITAVALRDALGQEHVGALWLRAAPGQLEALRPAWAALPAVVFWSLPSRASAEGADRGIASFGAGTPRPTVLVAQGWPVAETRLARLARSMVDALARDLDVGAALLEARRARAEAGDPPRVWGCLVPIGDAGTRVPLDRAPWLRRLLAPR